MLIEVRLPQGPQTVTHSTCLQFFLVVVVSANTLQRVSATCPPHQDRRRQGTASFRRVSDTGQRSEGSCDTLKYKIDRLDFHAASKQRGLFSHRLPCRPHGDRGTSAEQIALPSGPPTAKAVRRRGALHRRHQLPIGPPVHLQRRWAAAGKSGAAALRRAFAPDVHLHVHPSPIATRAAATTTAALTTAASTSSGSAACGLFILSV